MALSNVAREFILHWGEMGTRWGVNRTVAQVHALLYLSAEPLTAEDIAETLPIALQREHQPARTAELATGAGNAPVGRPPRLLLYLTRCVVTLSYSGSAAGGARD